MSLSAATWPDVPVRATVLVPLGSTEQHGPHLPLDTDTVIASAVAAELAPLVGATVAPAIPVGASGEHQSFPGTISIGTEALQVLLIELARSLTGWASRVVFVNGHGGNLDAVTSAAALLRAEGRNVSWVPCMPARACDAHAGRTETSLMLHLAPDQVRMRRAEPGNSEPLAALLPQMRVGGVAAVSPNGVLGDPARASAAEGSEILLEMVALAYHRISTEVRVP